MARIKPGEIFDHLNPQMRARRWMTQLSALCRAWISTGASCTWSFGAR